MAPGELAALSRLAPPVQWARGESGYAHLARHRAHADARLAHRGRPSRGRARPGRDPERSDAAAAELRGRAGVVLAAGRPGLGAGAGQYAPRARGRTGDGVPRQPEVQIGARAFVRAWANTQVGLANQEPDFLQVKVTTGTASFDLRTIEPGTRWRWTRPTPRSPLSAPATTGWT